MSFTQKLEGLVTKHAELEKRLEDPAGLGNDYTRNLLHCTRGALFGNCSDSGLHRSGNDALPVYFNVSWR